MAGIRFFRAIFAGGSDRDLIFAGVDREIHGMREEGAFLDMSIGDKAEGAALREDGGFVVDGAIFKAEEDARGNLIAAGDLNDVS